MSVTVILRCSPSGALALLGEPRRMGWITSFEARRKCDAHLRMTTNLLDQ